MPKPLLVPSNTVYWLESDELQFNGYDSLYVGYDMSAEIEVALRKLWNDFDSASCEAEQCIASLALPVAKRDDERNTVGYSLYEREGQYGTEQGQQWHDCALVVCHGYGNTPTTYHIICEECYGSLNPKVKK